ncbi:uncharacterized protein J3D65DRAFT_419403 [Phyllosticta citribraziliensis]|uniref:Tetraspanin n=1 Tax=Phyllosticta citribraziliensis TaxID=989973 RepID=A0ABR1LP28_9PEZI
MADKILLTLAAFELLFLVSGGLIMGFSVVSKESLSKDLTISNVAQHILLQETPTPLTAGIVNAVFIFVSFLFVLPAFFLRTNKGWLRIHGWAVVVSGTFTLIVGLIIWIETLRTRSLLGKIWASEQPSTQNLLQEKFKCCGYFSPSSPPFVQDDICPDAQTAAVKGGCIGKFSSFANQYLDVVFTAAFGIVGVDALVVMCVAMELKNRAEQARYRHIDEKNGFT